MSKYYDVLLYALFTAISFTFIDKLDNSLNPLLLLLFMSVCACLFFTLINYKHIGKLWVACASSKFLYSGMTIAIAINWLCSIIAPNDSDPFVYLAMTAIFRAICGLILQNKNKQRQEMYLNLICVFILICAVGVIHYNYIIGMHRSLNLGLVLGTLGGVSGYFYAHFSNKMVLKNDLTSTQILAVRFWPLIIILLFIVIIKHITITSSIEPFEFVLLMKISTIAKFPSFHNVLIIILMSALTLIVPTLFLQRSIKVLGAEQFSIFSAITPVMADIVYSISIGSINWSNVCISILISLVLMLIQLKGYVIRLWKGLLL